MSDREVPAILRREGLLTSAWYGALFFSFGANAPYWPVWLEDWGLTKAEIAAYAGTAMVVRLASGIFMPVLADRFAIRRWVLAGGALATSGMFLAHLFIETRPVLLMATLLAAIFSAPLNPIGEALGVRASARYGFAYAHARSVGSVAFLVMNVMLGWMIAQWGSGIALWVIALCYGSTAIFGALHPGGGAPPGTGIDTSRLREALALTRHPVFLTFAIAAAVGQGSHAVYYIYGSLAWLDQGISASMVGVLWAFGVFAEIVVLLGPGRAIVQRMGPARAIALGAVAGALRWTVMSFEPPLTVLWVVQLSHGVTFAVAHLGAMAFVAAAIPPRLQASAQGLHSGGLNAMAQALATLAAAAISAAYDAANAYWLAAMMSVIALAVALRLGRVWDGGRVAADQT